MEKRNKRILIMGDSMVEGAQVQNLKNLISSQLEILINGNARGCPRWEVIPMAMSGQGTAQYSILYEKFARKFSPDIVVIVTVYNDFKNNLETSPNYKMGADGRLEYVLNNPHSHSPWKISVLKVLRQFDLYHLYTTFRTMSTWNELYALNKEEAKRFDPWAWRNNNKVIKDTFSKRSWEYFERILARMKENVERDGARFIQVIENSDPRYTADEISERIHGICRKRSLECLSLLSTFRDEFARTRKPTEWPNDGHWNPLGHGLAAKALYARLKKLGWVDAKSCG